MIRFCDKIIYNIIEGEMSRSEILTFFLSDKERLSDVIAVYKESGEFLGTITYQSVLGGQTIVSCINRWKIHVTENFWEEARDYFMLNPEELLTVVDENDAILGFAYDDKAGYSELFEYLENIEKYGLPALDDMKYQNIKMLVITDLNEAAWKINKIFSKYGYQICVLGEKWEWFGYKSGEGYLDCAEFEKMYLYAEGTDFLRREKQFSASRYNNVISSFHGIMEIVAESMKYVYRNEMNKLIAKGAIVYEFALPSADSIEYKTELEWQSIELKADAGNYLEHEDCVSDKRKNCIEKIYGVDAIRSLKERGPAPLLNEGQEIFLGRLLGITLDKVDSRKKRIYLLGPCIVQGMFCLPEETLLGRLQQLVSGQGYQVVGIGIYVGNYGEWQEGIEKIPIRQGDIVCVMNHQYWFPEKRNACKRIDLSCIYNNPERNTMFSEMPLHSNAEGNRVLAKAIYEKYLKDEMARWKDCNREFLQKGEILNEEMIAEISGYTDSIKHAGDGMVGSIVMNCNPFTYGHRYLIEYAAKKVDILYIFVVEEDRSFFKFEDRMQMVKQGTKDLGNVTVVPSGRWVLSYETMPIYFEKAIRQEAQVDASKDLEIFARYIAPPLRITRRFVGEEPTDKVTRQYNQQMQEILGDFDIELEIIPRKELDGVAISASSVRRYMQEGNWKAVKKLVPETTYEKLIENSNIE